MSAALSAEPFSASAGISVKELVSLLKPRVMMLVVFTGLIGMMIAPGAGELHPFTQLLIVLCIALGSGAGGMINMWYDRDIDAIMKRTAKRPIPAGKIAHEDVLAGGIMLSAVSVMLLGMATNWIAAAWLAFAIVFYAVIYTMGLKRRTPQNIVIGGAAGAFPPVIGWAAVTGSAGAMEPWLMFAIIFLWTPPHFWALALFCNDDYRRANIPMLPASHGIKRTTQEMLVYSALLFGVSILPIAVTNVGLIYTSIAALLGLNFLRLTWNVYREEGAERPAKRLFAFSILYLFAIFLALGLDHVVKGVWL